MNIDDILPLAFLAAVFVAIYFLRQRMLGPTVSPEELAPLVEAGTVSVLDVRGPDEFHGKLGHIPGAVNIPVGELGEEIATLGAAEGAKDMPIATICRTHNRSPRAARMLRDAGFKNVVVLKGGMMAWKGRNLPIE